MLVAVDAVARCHLRELAATDRRPVLPRLVPPGEDAGRHERIAPRSRTVLAVVRDEHAAESARKPLSVIARHVRTRRVAPSRRPRQALLLQARGYRPVVLAVLADKRVYGEGVLLHFQPRDHCIFSHVISV